MGYRAKGPSEVLRGNLTGHAHTLQYVGPVEVLVAGDPALYVCMKEEAAVFHQSSKQ